jgi:hypothetical protein
MCFCNPSAVLKALFFIEVEHIGCTVQTNFRDLFLLVGSLLGFPYPVETVGVSNAVAIAGGGVINPVVGLDLVGLDLVGVSNVDFIKLGDEDIFGELLAFSDFFEGCFILRART